MQPTPERESWRFGDLANHKISLPWAMPPFYSSHGRCWPTPEACCLPWLSRTKPVFHLPRTATTVCAGRKDDSKASKGCHCKPWQAVPSLCFFPTQTPQIPCNLIAAAGPCMLPTVSRRLGVGHRLICIHSRYSLSSTLSPLTTTFVSRCIFPTVLPPPPPSFKGALPSDLPAI